MSSLPLFCNFIKGRFFLTSRHMEFGFIIFEDGNTDVHYEIWSELNKVGKWRISSLNLYDNRRNKKWLILSSI